MALSIERQQAIIESFKVVGKDPRELLPTPSPWTQQMFQDEELRHHLLRNAYDVIESTWGAGVSDTEVLQAMHQRRLEHESEHHIPEGKNISDLTLAEQKFYSWKFDQAISIATFQDENFQLAIEGLQSGSLTREDIISPTTISNEVVLIDFAAGED